MLRWQKPLVTARKLESSCENTQRNGLPPRLISQGYFILPDISHYSFQTGSPRLTNCCGITVTDVRPWPVQQGGLWTRGLLPGSARRAPRSLSSKYLAIIYLVSLPGRLLPPSLEDHHLRFPVPIPQISNANARTGLWQSRPWGSLINFFFF